MLWRNRFRHRCVAPIAGFLLGLLLLPIVDSWSRGVGDLHFFNEVAAAEVTIDSSASPSVDEHSMLGSQTVFVSNSTGYKFYTDGTGVCVYRKTTDGGDSWGSSVTFDNQTDCWGVVVWYDQWTPGDGGDYIHIISADSGNDVVWYNRLDTTSDTLLLGSSPVDVSSDSGQGGTFLDSDNKPSITKGTDGTVYIAMADNADSYVVQCATNCNVGSNWTETGTSPMDFQPDYSKVVPLPNADILLIQRDRSANTMRSKVWDDSAGSWDVSWSTIDSGAAENANYDPSFVATVNPATENIFLAYVSNDTSGAIGGGDDDIRTAIYSGGSWSNTTDVVTNSSLGITSVALGIDGNNDEVYITFTGRTTPGTANTANVYWATSTATMSSWGAQQGPVNIGSDDIRGIDVNFYSNQRLYASWFEPSTDAILGDTLADIAPTTVLVATGTQVASVRASTSDFYVGGTFALTETETSRSVTTVVLSETGTVDAASSLSDVRLVYDLDTTAPYNCVSESYSGVEPQFGSTLAGGFTSADGTATFNDTVAISPTQVICFYPILDIENEVTDGDTLEIEIADPTTDVSVTGGETVVPAGSQPILGNTEIINSNLTQTHFHWRNDDGNETGATSHTGGIADTELSAVQKETPVRLRFGVSNEGSTSTFLTTLRLEYATNPSTCSLATGWSDVNATDDAWNLYNSAFVVNGSDTTDISEGIGGVANENTVFLTPNGGQLDTSSETSLLTFSPNNWTELEFSIVASTSATEGENYCFRVTDAGNPLPSYDNYASAVVAADVQVTATGTQISNVDIPSTDVYIGGAFVITENSTSRSVTSVTLTETGTVDAASGIENIRLYYDVDTTAPYDCSDQSYGGSELQYGATSLAFSASNGTSTFTDSVTVSPTQTLCLYTILDISADAVNGDTFNLTIDSAVDDVTITGGGTISPATPTTITASTTLDGPVLTQSGYHWRNDDGDETAGGATSATEGDANTLYENFLNSSAVRLRMQVANEGATSSLEHRYGLEYGVKSTTCDAVGTWYDVDGAGTAWELFDSTFLTNGDDTTDIAEVAGGIPNPAGKSFLTPNGGVLDTESFSASTTITENQFLELEYSITTTPDTPYETAYCFRVTKNGAPLLAYDTYAELEIEAKRDFKVQRGEVTVSGSSQTLTAGIDYVAPSATSAAFVRITNSQHTGAGRDNFGGAQNAEDYGAYVTTADLTSSFTISRDTDSINNTYIAWEIVEYVGAPGGDNEMVVRAQDTISFSGATTQKAAPAIDSVTDANDVVVYITGQMHEGDNRNEAYAHQFTSEWDSGTSQPEFTRAATGDNAANLSYAIVEFTGMNWQIQRVEHDYTAAGVTETESITAVNSLERTFLHAQKRYGDSNQISDFGQEVWLSSIGAVSFLLADSATTTIPQVGVAWIMENTQTGVGAMEVQRSSGDTTGGTEPVIISVSLANTLHALSNASIFISTAIDQGGDTMPRPIVGASIVSTTTYELWRSEASGGGLLSYRTEVVEWPAADLAVRQNYYRFYVDNDLLTPVDPWPAGPDNLGENTPISAFDDPPAVSDRIRVRMTVRADNATLPTGELAVKLQYGELDTTCSAIATWNDIGAVGSGEIWRGYNASGVTDGVSVSGNPPTNGDLLLSIADRAGRYTEANPAASNQYAVLRSEDVEYDWHIEQNNAPQRTHYCLRMVRDDGSELDAYLQYPQLRTEGYTPVTQNWRWYQDEASVTPVDPLAPENTAPSDVDKNSVIKLRVTVKETENLDQTDARFKLQYSTSPNFETVSEPVATTSCTADSVWCYADEAGVDNALIAETVLSDGDACAASVGAGCGVHTESALALTGFDHLGERAIENEFTLEYTDVERNFGTVYYFRLYDVVNDEAVPVSDSHSAPSIGVESARLTFTVAGVDADTEVAGITTAATTTATTIGFGTLNFDTTFAAAQSLDITTNATEGYQILMYAADQLLNIYGDAIPPITATNAAPSGWGTACSSSATGCFGYHTTDGTLVGGSTRFAPTDSYAALSTEPREIMFSSLPVQNEVHEILYRIVVSNTQPAGDYQTNIVYIAVPTF